MTLTLSPAPECHFRQQVPRKLRAHLCETFKKRIHQKYDSPRASALEIIDDTQVVPRFELQKFLNTKA